MEEKEVREKLDELHGELETFPNPIRSISSRENNFRLESAGWGNLWFTPKLFLKIKLTFGSIIGLSYLTKMERERKIDSVIDVKGDTKYAARKGFREY